MNENFGTFSFRMQLSDNRIYLPVCATYNVSERYASRPKERNVPQQRQAPTCDELSDDPFQQRLALW